jgi:pullulanase/glycogen debranching enzyme
MRRIIIGFITFLFIVSASSGYSQVITVSPTFPTDADQVVVTFNTSLATSQSILNYTGDVYAHTGVKVEGSDAWANVIGTWGNNTTQPKLTKVSTYVYTLTISPNIRQYYGVPSDKKITKLCFVFRSSDSPYKQTSPDIFYNVYEQGITVDITNPIQDKPIYDLNSSVSIQVTSHNATLLKLFIDNVEKYNTSLTSITFPYTANTYGKHWIKAVGSGSTPTKKDSVYIIVRPEVVTEELPAGLKLGVNKIDNQSVTIVLYDPPAKKQYCYLIGNFNDWLIEDQYFMKRTADGKYYWITLTGLDPDKEYLYQFLVDGQIRIGDPYCTKTSDQYDHYISQTNYPNLISYPGDKTTGVVSSFKINEETYTWNTTSFTPPSKEKLVIYELHIRDFISGDYIKTVQDSLGYLQKLGVNAIELMPISEFQGNDSWGYNPSFYFAADKAYGTKNDYKAFIDDCHSRGIAVIQDIVLNHTYEESPMVLMYYNTSTYKTTADNPWYNVNSPNPNYSWGYDFNHQSVYTQQFVDSVLTYWLTEFKVDGFRFDFTKGFTNTTGEGSAYDASRIAILERMAQHIWDVKHDTYVILEHFCVNTEEQELSDYGMMIWGNLNYNYNEATMGYITTPTDNTDFSRISYKNRSWNNPYLVGYMESHDEERLMFKNEAYGNTTNAAYNIKSIPVGLARNELAALFFFTVPGPKMIWQFGELGYDITIGTDLQRTARKPIHWDYFQDDNRRHLLSIYTQLIKLKKEYPVFSTSNFTLNFSGANKWIKLIGSDMNAIALGNFNIQSENMSVSFPNTGWWYEYFSQDSVELTSAAVNYTFAPGEYRLYTTKRIKSEDIFVGINSNLGSKNDYSFDIWPNPTNGDFVIKPNYLDNDNSTLTIYSILGQRVFEQIINKHSFRETPYQVNLNSKLTPGIYLVRLQTGRQSNTRKIIIR